MVSYHCSNCGQYLKKKQGVDHGYCSHNLCCTICKTEVNGLAEVKEHNCPPGGSKKIIKPQQLEGINEVQWKGFKNTLRKVVKIQKERKADKSLLKKVMDKLVKKNNIKYKSFEKTFIEKLSKTKNIQVKGEEVIYNRKN